jgi:predicted type IV restriction endonuclease
MDNYGDKYPPGREIAVRYALIDPVLRALGWDLANPENVRLEWAQARRLRPDYTFLKNGKRVLYVEARYWGRISEIKKNFDDPLDSADLKKLQKYCKCNSVAIGAFTDGGAWYIVDSSDTKKPKVEFVDALSATKKDVRKLLKNSYDSL